MGKDHRWFAVAGLLAATAASAPIFMGSLHVTQDEKARPEERTVGVGAFEYPVEPLAENLLASASIPSAESLFLLSDALDLVPLDPLANIRLIDVGPALLSDVADDRSAGQGSTGGANTYQGFESGSPIAAANAQLGINPPAISSGAMPTIGGAYTGTNPPTALVSGAAPSAVAPAALPRSTKPSAKRASGKIQLPTSPTPADTGAGVGRANLARRPTPPADKEVQDYSPYLSAEETLASPVFHSTPEHGLVPNAWGSPRAEPFADVDNMSLAEIDDKLWALELLSPNVPLFLELEQPASDAASRPITAAATNSASVILFDAPTVQPSTEGLQANDPTQIHEPAILALLGLGLIALAFSRRTQ